MYGIRKADGCSRTPPEAMLRRPFRYRRSFMYAAVSTISYIEESVASWELEGDSVAKQWAFNIRLGYCAIFVASHQRLTFCCGACLTMDWLHGVRGGHRC